MPDFRYTARTVPGDEVTGVISAASRHDAVRQLLQQSLAPLEVAQEKPRRTRRRKAPLRQLAGFFAQLADLLQGGVPLLRSLEILAQQIAHPALADYLRGLVERVGEGASLADSMRMHPEVFGELTVSMVHAGEQGGFLEEALRRIAGFLERQEDLRNRVVGALAYPVFLLVVGLVVVTGMIVFFVPNFAPIFDRMREQGVLPTSTILLLALSDFLRSQAWWAAPLLLAGVLVLMRWLLSEPGRARLDRWKLRLAWIGGIVRQLAIARFCRVLGTLIRNGVPLLGALRIAKDAAGNRVLGGAIQQAAESVSAGRSLAQPLRACGEFPPAVLELIAVAEQANTLEHTLLATADSLERRANQQLDLFVRLLEPALLLVMAAAILFIVLALLLPVFQMSTRLA